MQLAIGELEEVDEVILLLAVIFRNPAQLLGIERGVEVDGMLALELGERVRWAAARLGQVGDLMGDVVVQMIHSAEDLCACYFLL